ncbi:MAG: hypothetical protein Q9164_002911 [Protoblastenia rupestris]
MATNATFTTSQTPHEEPFVIPTYSILLPLLLYPLLTTLLRHHRLRSTLRLFPYTTRRSFSSMTLDEAFRIQQAIGELEFPFTFEKALQFALFRTYGVPSISKLLVATKEFSEPATATKRYADTVVLVAEFTGYHPKSPRVIEAIGRMNYIHSKYQKAGKISNDDMLYTLSLFALEPVRWIGRYEWRELEDFEKCAIGTFWKAMGDAMAIDFGALKSGGGGERWVDGLQWLEEVEVWAEEYETKAMVPDKSNWKTAEQTMAILLWHVPNWAKPYGKEVVCALMDDRLRAAMLCVARSYYCYYSSSLLPLLSLNKVANTRVNLDRYDRPSQVYFTLVSVIFGLRKFILRYLSPPRPYFLRNHNTTDDPSQDGKYYMKAYEAVPWYVKPTLWNRFGPSTWISRIRGMPVPGDEGNKYWPKGFRIEEIGPESMRGKGGEYARESKEKLARMRMSGCPFARVKVE